MSDPSATRKVTVLNPAGLHARPSLAVVQTVRRGQSKVEVQASRQRVDAGDILQLLGLGAA
jgi:phosphotransferase system HPr (HPr) family protein